MGKAEVDEIVAAMLKKADEVMAQVAREAISEWCVHCGTLPWNQPCEQCGRGVEESEK